MENTQIGFIAGLPRSGTTLLSALLSNSSEVYCPSEPWIALGIEALDKPRVDHPADGNLVSIGIREFLEKHGRERVLGAAIRGIYSSACEAANRRIFVDKTPRYYHMIHEIPKWLPEARFIWLQRNPFAVAASIKSTWNISIASLIAAQNYSAPHLKDWVLGHRKLITFFETAAHLVVRYEELTKNPAVETNRALHYIGAATLEGREVTPLTDGLKGYMGDQKIHSTNKVHSDSIDSWKTILSEDEVVVLASSLGEACFSRMGYKSTFDAINFSVQELKTIEAYSDLLFTQVRSARP